MIDLAADTPEADAESTGREGTEAPLESPKQALTESEQEDDTADERREHISEGKAESEQTRILESKTESEPSEKKRRLTCALLSTRPQGAAQRISASKVSSEQPRPFQQRSSCGCLSQWFKYLMRWCSCKHLGCHYTDPRFKFDVCSRNCCNVGHLALD